MSEQEQPESCHCCGFEIIALKFYPWCAFTNKRPSKGRWLCDLCAGTMTSTFDEYADQHDRDSLEAMKVTCYVGNTILRALGEVALGRATNPWWQSLARQTPEIDLDAAMRAAFNNCHKGPVELAPGERPHVCGLSGTGFSCPACEVLSDQDFPQDATAVSSVLGDTCPRCGGQLEHHEGLERDYPSCPRCR